MQKHWSLTALFVFVLLLVPLFLMPEIANAVALAVLALALALSYAFIVRSNLQAQEQIAPARTLAKTALQASIVLLVVAAASLAGYIAGTWWGLIAGMVSAFGVLWIMSRV